MQFLKRGCGDRPPSSVPPSPGQRFPQYPSQWLSQYHEPSSHSSKTPNLSSISEIWIWNLKSEIWTLNSEIWHLKYVIWNMKSEIWNLEHEIWNLESGICNLKYEMWNLTSKLRNLKFEIWKPKSEIWRFPCGGERRGGEQSIRATEYKQWDSCHRKPH